ncbi:MAG: glycosyltransferase family 2 protein [Clostridia bacterium]|nr:glycosyltransferase family 2 protein [Clostridia bacterium]
MYDLTVFTPTYNRATTLERAYKSLEAQTDKTFIWLIIDDGSTDNTLEIIEKIKKIASFPVEYHKKENGGRHTAVNFSYQYLKTKYVVTLDSDDELLPNAVENMLNTWRSIPEEEYDRFWCISGREMYADSGTMVGRPYPPEINRLKGKKQRRVIMKCPGEKHCCRKVAIHIQYPFPTFPDTKFITENVVWGKINRQYDQYCVNDIYGKYYTDSVGSLMTDSPHQTSKHRSAFYRDIIYVNEFFDDFFFSKAIAYCVADISRRAILTEEPYAQVMRRLNSPAKKILVTLCYPIGYLVVKLKDRA